MSEGIEGTPPRTGIAGVVDLRRLVRYGAVSVLATATSLTTLALLVGFFGVGATSANVVATLVGTVPSFELNRRWVWGLAGRPAVGAQVAPFVGLSLLGLVSSTLAVHEVARGTAQLGPTGRVVAVELANVTTYGALWALQFVLLDRILFRRWPGAARRQPDASPAMAPQLVESPPSTARAAPVTPLASAPQSQAMSAAGSAGSSRRSTSCWAAKASADANP
jgi:putative flippase GtrA